MAEVGRYQSLYRFNDGLDTIGGTGVSHLINFRQFQVFDAGAASTMGAGPKQRTRTRQRILKLDPDPSSMEIRVMKLDGLVRSKLKQKLVKGVEIYLFKN